MPAVAEDIRSQVLRSKRRFWRPRDFDGSPGAVQVELSRLVNAGELIRVRRGLYWRGPRNRLGMTPPRPREVVSDVLGDVAVGEAEWSATNLLGLSTQLPRLPALAVPQRPPRGIESVRFLDRSARRGRVQARLTGVEVALLETLEGWERFVELPAPEAQSRLLDLIDSGVVSPKRLVRASETEPAVVRERLRTLLVADGLDGDAERIPLVVSANARDRAAAVMAFA